MINYKENYNKWLEDEEYALLCLKDIKEKNPEFYVAAFKNGGEKENLLED